MRAQFYELETFCTVCTKPVPPERLRFKAITCTEECARLRKLSMRSKQDARECRHCRKPSTPEERAAYQRFRRWEKNNPHIAYPEEYKRWQQENPQDEKVFTLDIAQRMAEEKEEDERRAAAQTHTEMGPIGEAGAEVRNSEAARQ